METIEELWVVSLGEKKLPIAIYLSDTLDITLREAKALVDKGTFCVMKGAIEQIESINNALVSFGCKTNYSGDSDNALNNDDSVSSANYENETEEQVENYAVVNHANAGTTAKEYMIEFLQSEGYRYEENPDTGHISFKFEGVEYVFVNNSGQQLMQICILFYDVDRNNRYAVLKACNAINEEKAMVKFTIDEDTVWANWEDIVPEGGYDHGRIYMALNMLKDAFQRFYDIIGE